MPVYWKAFLTSAVGCEAPSIVFEELLLHLGCFEALRVTTQPFSQLLVIVQYSLCLWFPSWQPIKYMTLEIRNGGGSCLEDSVVQWFMEGSNTTLYQTYFYFLLSVIGFSLHIWVVLIVQTLPFPGFISFTLISTQLMLPSRPVTSLLKQKMPRSRDSTEGLEKWGWK